VPYHDHVPDSPEFKADSPTPVYVQVADYLAARIASGELQPGARLPAERDMSRDLGVAYDTIRRATALLRERELIVTVVGKGTYVVER
jgi:GntR family transcriptional regulator